MLPCGLGIILLLFTCEELTDKAIRGEGQDILLSTQELFQLLAAAGSRIRGQKKLVQHSILPRVEKRKRSETPPDQVTFDDEVKDIEHEKRAAKHVADNDPDYENISISSILLTS